MTVSPVRRVVPLPPKRPPRQSKSLAIVSVPLPLMVAPPLMRSRPSPPKVAVPSTLSAPLSRCSTPAPSRSKVPESWLPLLLSLRSVSSVPSATAIRPPASALNVAVPPVPACM